MCANEMNYLSYDCLNPCSRNQSIIYNMVAYCSITILRNGTVGAKEFLFNFLQLQKLITKMVACTI